MRGGSPAALAVPFSVRVSLCSSHEDRTEEIGRFVNLTGKLAS